jgi:tRNA-dihydrouridine synthase B
MVAPAAQMYKGVRQLGARLRRVKNNPTDSKSRFSETVISTTPEKALEYKNRYGIDGIMIGRACIGYPWIFNEIKHFFATGEYLPPPTVQQRVDVIRRHLHRSVEWKGPIVGINEMRRHYTNYLKGLPNIKEFRSRLVTLPVAEAIDEVLDEVVRYYGGLELPRPTEYFYAGTCRG